MREYLVPVSTTIRPVTQTAEVEVKSASMKDIGEVVLKGRHSRIAPANIADAKDNASVCGMFKVSFFVKALLCTSVISLQPIVTCSLQI